MEEITAIILAGGGSTRMGADKAMLPLGGMTVIERLILELEKITPRIIIAAGRSEAYRQFGKQIAPDFYTGAGPLAGLHAGLMASPSTWNIAVACDMPFASGKLFHALLEQAEKAEAHASGASEEERTEAVIPRISNRVHPLLAVYRRSVLPSLETSLREGLLKMTAWTGRLRAEYVDENVLAAASGIPVEWLDFNMNRPADYELAKAWQEKH